MVAVGNIICEMDGTAIELFNKAIAERDKASAECNHLRSLYTHQHDIAQEQFTRALAAEVQNRYLTEEVNRLQASVDEAYRLLASAPPLMPANANERWLGPVAEWLTNHMPTTATLNTAEKGETN